MKIPPPGQEVPLSFPPVHAFRSSVGLEVLVVRDHRLPRVALELVFPRGRAQGPASNLAVSPLALDLLDKGTEEHSAAELARWMDRSAIRYQAHLGLESASLSMTFLEDQLETALELLAELVAAPTFPQPEVEKACVRWQSHLLAERARPAFLARERAFRTLYGSHPYSRVSVPLEDLRKVTAPALLRHWSESFGLASAILAFSGDVEPERAARLVERHFPRAHPAGSFDLPAPDPQLPPEGIALVERPHSVQARLVVAARTIARNHPQWLALEMANQVLGGGGSARLFLNLRERHAYTYGAYSRLEGFRRDGLYLISADVASETALAALGEIMAELEGMGRAAPAPEELERCRAEKTGLFLRHLESPEAVAVLEVSRRLFDLPPDYFARYPESVRAVSPDQVLEASRRFFAPGQARVTVVGERRLESGLAALGEVSVYDSEGRLL